jgi:hypothetical protein
MLESQPKIEAGDLDFTNIDTKIASLKLQITRAEMIMENSTKTGNNIEKLNQEEIIAELTHTLNILEKEKGSKASQEKYTENTHFDIPQKSHMWGTDERPSSRDSL